jgi:hypothetical protein
MEPLWLRSRAHGIVSPLKVWDRQSGAITTFSCDASATCCAVAKVCTIVAGDFGGRVYFLALEGLRDVLPAGKRLRCRHLWLSLARRKYPGSVSSSSSLLARVPASRADSHMHPSGLA